jgi:Cu-processing system permease protein
VVAGVYREVALALTFAAGLVLALALAANRVPAEVERRTLYNVLAKPVRRLEYLIGTWLGVIAVMAAVIAGFTVMEQVVGLVRYQDAMWLLWQGAFAIWLELGVVSALTVALSGRTGPIVVVVAALTFLFAGHARDSLLGADGSPMVRAIYPSLDTFNIINPVAHGAGVGIDYLAGMLLAFVGWAGVLLLLGVLAFEGRDL